MRLATLFAVRAKDMFLGVDLMRRAIESFKRKSVVAAWNSWLTGLRAWKRRQMEKRGGVKTIDHVLRRLINRTISTCFTHWMSWLAAEKVRRSKSQSVELRNAANTEAMLFNIVNII